MSDKVTSSTSSRIRAPNYTRDDQELLTEVLKPYLHIIDCRKTGTIQLSQKTGAWSKVCLAFNAKTNDVPRSKKSLIGCYRNMKSKLKKQHSKTRLNLRDKIDEASEKSSNESLPALLEEKSELVKLQTEMMSMKIKHNFFLHECKIEQIKLKIQEQELLLEHRKKMHKLELELEHMRKMHAVELEDAMEEEFEEVAGLKELMLLDWI